MCLVKTVVFSQIGRGRRMQVAIIGLGSIGQRHLHNLLRLGVDRIIGCDPKVRSLVFEPDVAPYVDKVSFRLDYRGILGEIDAAFICTPPASHIPIALKCAEAGLHLFIEKPLSNSLDGVAALRKVVEDKRIRVQMGFNWRFHPEIAELCWQMIDEKFGKRLFLSIVGGSYLPDWRGGDYRDSYSASREEGGVILDCFSHAFDLAEWLLMEWLGQIVVWKDHSTTLEIGAEDMATALAKTSSGTHVVIHENYLAKLPWFEITVVGTEKVVSIHPQAINEMYVAEARRFVDGIKKGIGYNAGPDLMDGIRNLKLCLEARG